MKDGGDLTSKEGWQWLDGTEYSWQSWASEEPNGQPDGASGEARMVSDGEWRDYPASAQFKYTCICERKQSKLCIKKGNNV